MEIRATTIYWRMHPKLVRKINEKKNQTMNCFGRSKSSWKAATQNLIFPSFSVSPPRPPILPFAVRCTPRVAGARPFSRNKNQR